MIVDSSALMAIVRVVEDAEVYLAALSEAASQASQPRLWSRRLWSLTGVDPSAHDGSINLWPRLA